MAAPLFDMRRFLIASFFTLALVISAAGAAPAAHAALNCPVENGNQSILGSDDLCHYFDASGKEIGSGVEPTETSDTLTQPTVNASDAATPIQMPQNPDNSAAYSGIMVWIMSLFAWLVGVAAITLDNAVYYTVVTMGSYVNNLSAIGVTWRILRDIGNIMLIFGFLAVGITTILNVGWYGGGKRMLPMMLVAAVFLNFSLFISEAIIDTGNLFATQFYTQINGGLPAGAKNLDLASVSSEGISNKIMNQLGLQTIYGDGTVNREIFKAGNTWVIGFMGIILFLITAFVLFSLAFVLIARFVILIFLIILAPIGFAGLAVPQLAARARKWWDKLFEQVITAPILLLMLYIALAIITDVHFLTGFGSSTTSGGWTGFVQNATGTGNLTGFAGLLLSFIVAMGLLIAVVIQSKNLSAFGADWASKTAGKLTFGLTAAGMRTTAGWGLQAASKRFRSSKLVRVPVVGRMVAGGLDRGAKASFDVRGATVFGGLKATGIDAGKAQVGGYRKELEEAIKGREEHAKTLQLTSAEKEQQAMWASRSDAQKELHDEELNRMDAEQRVERQPQEDAVKAQRAKVAELRARAGRTKSDADKKELAGEELTLANQVKEVDELRSKQQEARKKLEALQKETLTNIEGKIQRGKRAPQEGYAKNLEMMPWGVLTRNSEAARKIREAAGKSKEQKDVETLLDMVKKAVPPAGGAPPAAAPAAPAAPGP